MNITLNTKEFNKAVELYLSSLGFSIGKFDIGTKVIVGRSGNETRAEVTLEPREVIDELEEDNINSSGSVKEDKVPFEPDNAEPKKLGSIFNNGGEL